MTRGDGAGELRKKERSLNVRAGGRELNRKMKSKRIVLILLLAVILLVIAVFIFIRTHGNSAIDINIH
jgi:Trk-type K+ transport system membrane component